MLVIDDVEITPVTLRVTFVDHVERWPMPHGLADFLMAKFKESPPEGILSATIDDSEQRAADEDDHYYGAWSGGKKSEGGHPEGEGTGEGKTKTGGGAFEKYRLAITDPQAGYDEYMALTKQLGHIDWAKGITPDQRAILDKLRALDPKAKPGDLADAPPLSDADVAAIAADPELTAGVLASRYGLGYREYTINRVVGTSPEGKPISTDDYTLTALPVTAEMRAEMLTGIEAAYLASPKPLSQTKFIEWGRTPSQTAIGQNVMGAVALSVGKFRDAGGQYGVRAVMIHEIAHSGEPKNDLRFDALDALETPPAGFTPAGADVSWREEVQSVIAWEQDRLATQTTDFGKQLCIDAIAKYESFVSGKVEVRVSNYAGMNSGEHYAEMYRMFVLDPKGMAADFPLQYAYMVASK